MRVTDPQIKMMLDEAEIKPEKLCAEADISIGTLRNIYGKTGAGIHTVKRVRKTLERLKRESEEPAVG